MARADPSNLSLPESLRIQATRARYFLLSNGGTSPPRCKDARRIYRIFLRLAMASLLRSGQIDNMFFKETL